ncbi:MAG TPA: nuclear transport factor 2 family protein [Candidatus Limnocylindria bacterium]|nr:nuclear transport factor 2 family protein [Candidatus Limnocylindria bacterium]
MSSRLDAFTLWLTAFGDAWESADAAGLGPLFTVGATFLPDPFADVIRGRKAVVAYFANLFAELPSWSFSAQVLGVGDTYGVAHWRVSSADRALDGVWVVALDARGRCESLREWSSEAADNS